MVGLLSFVPDNNKKKKPIKKTTPVKRVVKPLPNPKSLPESPYYIIVDKSDYELKVYDEEGWYATYPIVFGSKDLSDKMREGDKRTPTGSFKVILKKIHHKWGPELPPLELESVLQCLLVVPSHSSLSALAFGPV